MKLAVRPLTPDLWPQLEELFGRVGACNGCWCMYWRIGSAYTQRPREDNKKAFKAVVKKGPPPGLVAFAGEFPVGWAQVTPRAALPGLDRGRFTRAVDDAPVWSLSCFYIRKGWRGKGVMTALIEAAVAFAKKEKAPALEAYPMKTDGARRSTSGMYTGAASSFERAGFKTVATPAAHRPIMRLDLKKKESGMKFLDIAKVYAQSGNGGNGCVAFRREKFIEYGGPWGGNGGRGGDVVVEAVDHRNTLIDFRFQQHVRAKNGEPGMGKEMTGGHGDDAIMKVPPGTQVYEEDGETLIADLATVGQRIRLLRGGNGGFGNAHFKSSTNQAPRHANPGQPGEEKTVILKLKLIADAGLIGMPNAGKSTFLSRVSAARPKIADYPFTTLEPQLGVVGIDETDFVLADLPGLIEGAHEGVGLGDRFLGHAERCNVILHLIDGTQSEIAKTYKTIRAELEAYGNGLESKPEIVALNKSDAIPKTALAKKRAALEKACGHKVMVISGVSGDGVEGVLRALAKEIVKTRVNAAKPVRAAKEEWSP